MDAYSMDIIWYKVWRDLAGNKARTALAVLSTAVGVLALGVVLSFSRVLDARLAASQRAAAPAHVTVWGGPFGPDAAEAVAREPGVAAVEGETIASFRWRQEGEAGWRTGDLVAREDYTAQRINLLRLLDGHWPDPYAPRALGVERMSALFFDLPPGATFLVEYGQHQRRVTIEGIVRAPIVLPPAWGGNATFYAMPGTAAWVTGSAWTLTASTSAWTRTTGARLKTRQTASRTGWRAWASTSAGTRSATPTNTGCKTSSMG
jgi:putative ABC transport system permease protein